MDYPQPRLIWVPRDVKMRDAEKAFLLCQQLGLIVPEPNGWLLMPEEIKWPGASRSELFLEPPELEPPARR